MCNFLFRINALFLLFGMITINLWKVFACTRKVFGKTSFITSLDHPGYVACGNIVLLEKIFATGEMKFDFDLLPLFSVTTVFQLALSVLHSFWQNTMFDQVMTKSFKSTFQFFSYEKWFCTTIKEKNYYAQHVHIASITCKASSHLSSVETCICIKWIVKMYFLALLCTSEYSFF